MKKNDYKWLARHNRNIREYKRIKDIEHEHERGERTHRFLSIWLKAVQKYREEWEKERERDRTVLCIHTFYVDLVVRVRETIIRDKQVDRPYGIHVKILTIRFNESIYKNVKKDIDDDNYEEPRQNVATLCSENRRSVVYTFFFFSFQFGWYLLALSPLYTANMTYASSTYQMF